MSFGFAVGDVLAVISLAERICAEVKSYRDAPSHFQNLLVELSLLQKVLHNVMQLQPGEAADIAHINHIRAVALHCQQPLQRFLEKMKLIEGNLGSFRNPTRSFNAVRTRLHWSLISRDEVESLRKVILSELTAISVLLGVHQLGRLKTITTQGIDPIRQSLLNLHNKTDTNAQETSQLLALASTTPATIANLHHLVHSTSKTQDALLTNMDQQLQTTASQISTISLTVKDTQSMTRMVGNQMSVSVSSLLSILRSIYSLVRRLQRCTHKVLEEIKRSAKALLDIQSQMKRIVRAIEAIPLHLTLGIVRLDDALGESWALPFQACTEWESFKNILQNVVYGNFRPGAARVAQDRFVILSARTGQRISGMNWKSVITSGYHVQQAMLLEAAPSVQSVSSTAKCAYPNCDGQLATSTDLNPKESCLKCGRWSRTERHLGDLLQDNVRDPIVVTAGGLDGPKYGPMMPSMKDDSSDVSLFRRVLIENYTGPVKTYEEAQALLNKNASNAGGLQFMGWHYLGGQDPNSENLSLAIDYLEKSSKSDPFRSQTWYLLGRAYMMRQRASKQGVVSSDHKAAYEAYQKAVYRNGRSPMTWTSVGILYYQVNRFRDSLNALARGIRLNPYIPNLWHNLGILYDAAGQSGDALDAYTRCAELESHLNLAETHFVATRIRELEALREKNMSAVHNQPMLEPSWIHSVAGPQETKHSLDIQLRDLKLDSGQLAEHDDDEWVTDNEKGDSDDQNDA